VQAGGEPLTQNDEVRHDPQAFGVENLWVPKARLYLVNRHERTHAVTQLPGELQVPGLHLDGLAVHHDGLRPEARDPLTQAGEGGLELLTVVGLDGDDLHIRKQPRPHAPQVLGEHVGAVVVAVQHDEGRAAFAALSPRVVHKLDLHGRRAGHGAGGCSEQHGVQSLSVGLQRLEVRAGVRQLHQLPGQTLHRCRRDVAVVVPHDAAIDPVQEQSTKLRVVVAPSHLIVPAGAVEVQLALLGEVE